MKRPDVQMGAILQRIGEACLAGYVLQTGFAKTNVFLGCCRLYAKLRQLPLSLAILTAALSIAAPAQANSWPPMAVPIFHLPLVASIISFGIGFVLIVCFEGWTLCQRERRSFWSCLWMVLIANLLSTLAGGAFVLCLTALPFLYMGTRVDFVALALILTMLLSLGWCTARTLKSLTGWGRGHFLLWSVVWGAVLYGEVFLVRYIYDLNPLAVVQQTFPDWRVPFYINGLQLLAAALYFAVGFVLSLVFEGFWLARSLPQATTTLGKTVLVMNVRSYCYIVIPLTIWLLFLK